MPSTPFSSWTRWGETPRPPWSRYTLALGLTALMTLLRWGIDPWLGDAGHYTLFYLSVTVMTVWGGWGVGMVSVGLGALAGFGLFVWGLGHFNPSIAQDYLQFGLYCFTGSLIVVVGTWGRGQRMRADRMAVDYRLLVEHQTDLVARMSRDGRRLYVNPNYCRLVGKTEAEVLASHYAPEIHPEDLARVAEEWQKTFQPPQYRSEIACRTRTVEGWRWLSWRNSAVLDAQGEPTTAICVGRDVTEIRQAQAAMRDSEERLLLAAEGVDLGIWDLDLQTNVATRTLRHDQIFGYSQLQPLWTLDIALQHVLPEDRPIVLAAHEQAAKTGKLFHEVRVRWPDGSIHWISARGRMHYDPEGKPLRIAGVVTDITEHKHAEAERMRLAEHRRMALEAARMVAWDFNPATGEVLLSDNAAEALDLPGGEKHATSDRGYNLIHPDDVERHRALVEQAIHAGGGYLSVYRHARGEQVIWLEERGQAVVDGAGKTDRLVGVTQNITERKRAEEALRQSQADLQTFLNTAAIGLVRNSRDLRYLSVNTAYARLVGRPEEQIVGRSLAEVLGDQALEKIRPHVERVLRGERVEYEAELPFAGSGPRWIHVIYVPDRDAAGNVIGWVGSISDITERKQAEEALRDSEARFRSVAENLSEGLMLFDPQGNLIYQNAASLRIHGFDPSDPGQIPHAKLSVTWEAWDEQERPIDFAEWPVSRVFRHERFQNQVLHVRRVETGQEFYGSYNGCPVFNREGTLQFGFITIRDISMQMRAMMELRRLKDELEIRVEQRTAELAAANKELEAFGYTVSHDLRAPLRHVTGFIELLQDHAQASLDRESREYLKVIADSAGRMGRLIDDLLTLSRLGRATMTQARVDLRQLVEGAIAELAPAVAGRSVQWQIGPLPQVAGDPTLLQNVLVNLISNALKYSRHRHPACIQIGSQAQDGEVVCFVKDNGAGFDMKFVDKLFGVFQRLHTAEQFEGNGIGLASVRRIIQRHGGRVWAHGAVDQGATFFFSLPNKENQGRIHERTQAHLAGR